MAKRKVLYGFYSLLAQIWNVDVPRIITDIQSSNFTGLSLHGLSPWGQHPDKPWYPWRWNGIRFELNKPNRRWYRRLKRFLRAMFEADLDVQFCFFDSYAKDAPRGIHPFTHNTFAVDWSKPKPLYDNWIAGQGFVGWLKWDDDPVTGAPINFRPDGVMGLPLTTYVKKVFTIVDELMQEIPTGRFSYKPYNETRGDYRQQQNGGWHSTVTGSLGDREEVPTWMKQEAAALGLMQNRRFAAHNDFGIVIGSPTNAPNDIYAQGMQAAYKGTVGQPLRYSALEIHNVGIQHQGNEVKDAQWYQDHGFDLDKCLLSTDGVQMSEGFKQVTADLFDSGAPAIDLKQEEASVPYKWDDTNMQRNWDKAFDAHAELIE